MPKLRKKIETQSKPKNKQICKKCSYKISANKKIKIKNGEKICQKCFVSKPATIEFFALTKRNTFYSYCRNCKKKYLKELREKNTNQTNKKIKLSDEQLKKNILARRQSDKINKWFKLLCNSSRHNAKRYNMVFEIDEDFIKTLYTKQNGLCYWFKIPLVPSTVNRAPDKPSLDRIDCTKGYTKKNVVLTCMCANIGRNSCSSEVFKEFCEKLK